MTGDLSSCWCELIGMKLARGLQSEGDLCDLHHTRLLVLAGPERGGRDSWELHLATAEAIPPPAHHYSADAVLPAVFGH